MARKKKNGGGMSTVRKWGKRILSGVRVIVTGRNASAARPIVR